jgi:hypothetical protein
LNYCQQNKTLEHEVVCNDTIFEKGLMKIREILEHFKRAILADGKAMQQ